MQPLVSVLICSYNAEKFIESTIKSVLNQTYRNIEVLILDNASTDNTCNMIEKIKLQNSKFNSNSKIKKIQIPGVKLRKVVDPTGAGDAWRGGFISSYCHGFDIEDCLAMGNAVASFAVETYGTINYKLRVTELRKRLRSINPLTY